MKKKHHFIPQFYLRRFASIEPDEKIWTYDIELEEGRTSTIENTAYEKYLYSVTLENGQRSDEVEDFFSKIEAKAAPIFNKLIESKPLTDQERASFASFMALMYLRTDSFRNQYAEIMMNAYQLKMYATAQHDGAFQNLIKDYQRDQGPLTKEEIKSLKEGMLNPQKFIVSVDKEWSLQALKFYEKFCPIFYKMCWSILLAPEPHYFITSDNPLFFDVPPAYQHPFYGGGLIHKKVQLTFPLSQKTCLMATWDKELPREIKIKSSMVKQINKIRSVSARRFLFGPRRDIGIERLGKKYKDVKSGIKLGGFGPEEYSTVELRRKRGR